MAYSRLTEMFITVSSIETLASFISLSECSIYFQGCWEKLKKDVQEDTIVFGVVVGVFILVQVSNIFAILHSKPNTAYN